jgi:hypothetical protein
VVELCDGRDNDGDDRVDEGFGDVDSDGIADCVDATCQVDDASAGSVSTRGCFEGVEAWSDAVTTTEWSIPSTATFGLRGGLVVAPIFDDNGDGVVSSADGADVVLILGMTGATLGSATVVDVRTGRVGWSIDGGWPIMLVPTVADLDADGTPDVLGMLCDDDECRVTVWDHTGTVEWSGRSGEPLSGYRIGARAVIAADLDADGNAEISSATERYSRSGDLLNQYLPIDGIRLARVPLVADVDQDGSVEVLTLGAAYTPDGELLWDWAHGAVSTGPVPVQWDADPQAALVWLPAGPGWVVSNHDGSVIASGDLEINDVPLAVADLDGDGQVEVLAGCWKPSVLNRRTDGTTRIRTYSAETAWLQDVTLPVDLDGDGRHELLLWEHNTRDGMAFGAGDPVHVSGWTSTVGLEFSAAVAVDLGLEGHLAVVASFLADSAVGVRVFEHAGAGWASAPPVWPGFDYQPTRFRNDLTVPPASTEPWWITSKVYRAPPAGPGRRPDLRVAVHDACLASCELDDAELRLTTTIENVGDADTLVPVTVSLYRTEGGERVWLQDAVVAPIPAGTSVPGPSFLLERGDVPGRAGMVVAVDATGVVTECEEGDNEAVWTSPCGE